MILVLKENTLEIRNLLKEAGIIPCICTEFKDAAWLDYTGATFNMVHGVGYYDKDFGTNSVKEELERFVSENMDIVYCKDVNEFINQIKELKNGRSNKK